MSRIQILKSIKTNNENKSSKVLNIELSGSNIRKILRLNHNRLYTTIKVEKNSYEKNIKIKKVKTQPNLKVAKIFNSNKKIMQEKEKKYLEKIYKKWELPTLSSRFRKINNIRKFDVRKFNISYSKNLNNIKNELKNKILYQLKVNEYKKKNFFDEKERQKFEEKKKKIEKLNQIQSTCNMIYLSENINEIEKKMENELNIIYEKANLFLDEKNNDLNEKLNYILIIEKYLKKEVIVRKENMILPDEAASYPENNIIRILGYFGSEISLSNIKTYIEINPSKEKLRNITFKILASGLATHKIYRFILDNQKLKKRFEENIDRWFTYLENIKSRISTIFNISRKDIIYFGHNFSKFGVYVLIHNNKVINLDGILKNFGIIIISNTLLSNIILSPNIFDYNYCKDKNDWKATKEEEEDIILPMDGLV